jgi:2-C-methyl-D-erythritol 4-phosphate cytidylyltransferase
MSGVWVVLVAAGRGERLGGELPKAFAPLAGRPLLAESLERLDMCPRVEAIVVVAPADWEAPAILLSEEIGAGKVTTCVPGGNTRAGSVRIGVEEIDPDADVIVVHDAARPLVSDEVIERVLGPLGDGWDGAVPGLPIADTVKRAPEGIVVETVDRSGLYAVQTPQAFLAPGFRRALAGSPDDRSDCAGFVESAGGRIKVVQGDTRLMKVTTAADLAAVERLLARSS